MANEDILTENEENTSEPLVIGQKYSSEILNLLRRRLIEEVIEEEV